MIPCIYNIVLKKVREKSAKHYSQLRQEGVPE